MSASGILDLNGQTYTIQGDLTEYWFQVTNTSATRGILVLEAGAQLVFDDSEGAGFLAGVGLITLQVDGNSDALCEIKSANSYPDHRWVLPRLTDTLACTRCKFLNYQGDLVESANWRLTNCDGITDPYAFATITELVNLTGSSLSDTVLREILGQATNEMQARLEADGVIVSITQDPVLRSICLKKAQATMLLRYVLNGSFAGSVAVDGVTSQINPSTMIKQLDDAAEEMLQAFVRNHLPADRSRGWIVKVKGS